MTTVVNMNGINELDLNLAGTVTAATTAGVTTITQTGVAALTLETNGTPNGSQNLLNLQQGSNITIVDGGTGTVTISGSASTPPGGSNTQVQYNNSGVFGGITGATSNGTNLAVTTQPSSDNSTNAASTAFVTTAINNAIAGVNPAVAVVAATTGVLPNTPTYSNGVGGIGATLTAGSNGVLTIDGYTPTINQRLLIKNQASAFQNGVYTISQLGTSLLPYILIRSLDYDQPSDINSTGAIPVINGTVNGTTQWVITSTVNTVGTDDLTYAQFTLNPSTIVTAVSGSAPIISSGGTTPAISVSNATSSTVGVVKPDNVSITISAGVLTAVGAVPPTGVLSSISYTSVTRPLNTARQNTSSFPIIVAYVDNSTTANVVGITDSSSTPTTVVWSNLTNSGNSNCCIFLVMPNNYYKVTGTTWGAWREYTFNTGSWTSSGNLSGAGRVLGTNYQNTGAGAMIVQIVSTGATLPVFCDATTTPTTEIFAMSTVTTNNSVFFVVPPSYYYRVTGGTLASWYEYSSGNIPAAFLTNTSNSSANLAASPAIRRVGNGSAPLAYGVPNTTGKVKFISTTFTNGNTGTTLGQSDVGMLPQTSAWQCAQNGGNTKGILAFNLPGEWFAPYQDSGTSATSWWYELTLG